MIHITVGRTFTLCSGEYLALLTLTDVVRDRGRACGH